MTPVLPCPTSNISLIPGTAFSIKKNNRLKSGSLSRKSAKFPLSSQRPVLPLWFPQYRRDSALLHRSIVHKVSATGTDVAVEESDSPVTDKNSSGSSEIPGDAAEAIEKQSTKLGSSPAAAQSRRSRPNRKSEMPPVKNEDLVPGATFTGKVRSIQPFGAFVDFGAFTDGLVHVSRLSDSYVKDVGSVVSVGQEVTVRLVEANAETGRISLTMRENDNLSRVQQRDSSATGSSNKQAARRSTSKPNQRKEESKGSKFIKGQDLEGTVKNMNRAGAFISLPEGEEGFLPRSEESDDVFASMMGESSLQLGQEVSVRVLRVSRGQVTLTMKKEEHTDKLGKELIQGVVYTATNPFALAFRKNKEIASFLDEREKAAKQLAQPKPSVEIGEATQTKTVFDIAEVQDQAVSSDQALGSSIPSTVDRSVEDDETSAKEVVVGADVATEDKEPETIESSISQSVDATVQTLENEAEANDNKEPESLKSSSLQSMDDKVQTLEKESEADEAEKLESIESVEALSSSVPSTVDQSVDEDETSAEVVVGADIATEDKVPEIIESSVSQNVDSTVQTLENEVEASTKSSLSQSVDDSVQTLEKESEANEIIESSLSQSVDSTVQTLENEVEASTKSSLSQSVDDSVQTLEKESEANEVKELENTKSSSSWSVIDTVQTIEKEAGESSGILDPEGSVSAKELINEEVPSAVGVKSDSLGEITGQALSSKSSFNEEFVESQSDNAVVKDEEETPTPTAENENSSEEEDVGANSDENGSVTGSEKFEASEETAKEQVISSEGQVSDEVVENQVESIKEEVKIQTPAAETEISSASQPEDEKAKLAPEINGTVGNANGQSTSASKSVTKATISPALVKQLREETGAGMMDCKKALSETGGDIIKAQEFLRKKGLASAEKKASRATAEGRIGSYIHDSRIGVLVEVNCETDFVSRGDIFKELVDDLAMQVAACPQVQYLLADDVPEDIVNKEREIEMQKEDLLSKPEQIRSKIVEGRIRKRLEELALLEQPYIKNDKVVVKDWVKQTIATIGENIKVKRFIRYNLGEGLEKKSQDFAAEVAAQTAVKPAVAPANKQPADAEAKETAQKPPTVTVSAALVKQLREETGAGMMDCKKALSETGGDLEKAQEYLRKKGLSTADKKSSRLAAEGRIGSYIHDARIGVLIEVNSETDFVGRSEKFKELVDDLAMQVVACPLVQFVSIEDIPESIVKKEKELEMQREDLLSKPENIREKIVEGRVSKRLGELALLEQPFIKDDSILVKDLVKQTVAALGENIKVRRFVRFTLGESTEDTKVESEA